MVWIVVIWAITIFMRITFFLLNVTVCNLYRYIFIKKTNSSLSVHGRGHFVCALIHANLRNSLTDFYTFFIVVFVLCQSVHKELYAIILLQHKCFIKL